MPKALIASLLGLGLHSGAARSDTSAAQALPPLPYFKLQHAEEGGADKCLEANRPEIDAVFEGATFLDRCQNVTGQAWLAENLGDGRFRLRSLLHASLRCLAPNDGSLSHLQPGTPIMATCRGLEGIFDVTSSGSGFTLQTVHEGKAVCLGADLSGSWAIEQVPVTTAACDGSRAQLWRVTGGHLMKGLPVAARGEPMDAADGAADGFRWFDEPVMGEQAGHGECLWNDGMADRPLYYQCQIVRTDDGRRTLAIGEDYAHAFVLEPDQMDTAQGFLRVGDQTMRLGRFERRIDNRNCWVNDRSGERLCTW